jgi:hypothetical protein
MVRASVLGAVVFAVFPPLAALAVNEFQRITPNDPAINDNFGYSVGLSGNTAIIGSWKDDRGPQPGDDAGSAYFFRREGSGTWTQLDKVTASDADETDQFGSSVAIDGQNAVIGAMLRGDVGGAYIFRDNGTGDWQQVDILAGNDATMGANFGVSVAIAGNTAIVGAWQNDLGRGAAYVFRDNGAGDWTQVAKLSANDAMPGDQFGGSVAISGNTALVGAHFESNTAGPLVGAVYVFEESGGTWSQADKLVAGDAHLAEHFGRSVAIDGNTAVIGATGVAAGGAESGAAYVFRRDATLGWQESQQLLASDAAASDLFGYAVDISDDTVIVGAYQDDDGGLTSGSAYYFKQNSLGSWHQVSKLTASDDAAGDAFGFSVAASGTVGLVGAPLSNRTGIDAGAAYLFNAPAGIPGDFNADGRVDAADFVVWRNAAGQTGTGLAADGNGDGSVNDADYQQWRANFGLAAPANPGPLQSAAVPEPASIVLVQLAVAFLVSRRPSRK